MHHDQKIKFCGYVECIFFLSFWPHRKKEKAEKQTLGEYFSKEEESTQTFHVLFLRWVVQISLLSSTAAL